VFPLLDEPVIPSRDFVPACVSLAMLMEWLPFGEISFVHVLILSAAPSLLNQNKNIFKICLACEVFFDKMKTEFKPWGA